METGLYSCHLVQISRFQSNAKMVAVNQRQLSFHVFRLSDISSALNVWGTVRGMTAIEPPHIFSCFVGHVSIAPPYSVTQRTINQSLILKNDFY
jgi:hypothetical protein